MLAVLAREPTMLTSKNDTGSALERAVEATGRAWAAECADALRREGRPVVGGWPGTLSEARVRVVACARERVGRRNVTHAELETLTKRAYETARKTWLASAEAEE